jgi:hypothetical protein
MPQVANDQAYRSVQFEKSESNLCYTLPMQGLNYWVEWSKWLEERGLKEPIAAFLDTAAPLHIILAQMVYLTQPFTESYFSREKSNSLAMLLEDGSQRREFSALLRQEITH